MIDIILSPEIIQDYKSSIDLFFERNKGDSKVFHPHELSYSGLLKEIKENPKNYYVFFMDKDNILGYGMLRGWQEEYEIPSLGIMIDIKQRGKGISKDLMDHLETITKARGSEKIRLTVYKWNLPAVSLYKKMGYTFSEKNDKELIGIKKL